MRSERCGRRKWRSTWSRNTPRSRRLRQSCREEQRHWTDYLTDGAASELKIAIIIERHRSLHASHSLLARQLYEPERAQRAYRLAGTDFIRCPAGRIQHHLRSAGFPVVFLLASYFCSVRSWRFCSAGWPDSCSGSARSKLAALFMFCLVSSSTSSSERRWPALLLVARVRGSVRAWCFTRLAHPHSWSCCFSRISFSRASCDETETW